MRNKLQQAKTKMKLINDKVLKEINLDRKENLLRKQQEIYLKESELRNYYESLLNKWESDIEKKRIYIDKKRDELKEINNKIKKLNPKEPLYEMDTRKDHIMTNLEVALNNADLFLKKNFFPLEYKNSDFKTIRDILYKQDGFFKESKDEILVSLKHYHQEPEHQMLAEYVVEKFNEAKIFTDEGKRLLMKVV